VQKQLRTRPAAGLVLVEDRQETVLAKKKRTPSTITVGGVLFFVPELGAIRGSGARSGTAAEPYRNYTLPGVSG